LGNRGEKWTKMTQTENRISNLSMMIDGAMFFEHVVVFGQFFEVRRALLVWISWMHELVERHVFVLKDFIHIYLLVSRRDHSSVFSLENLENNSSTQALFHKEN
jgi:hypothetical protein